MNSLQYKDLLINFTTEFVPVWNDKGTRAEKPVTFWRPSTSSDALGNFVRWVMWRWRATTTSIN